MTTIAFDTETHGLDWWAGEIAFLGTWADGGGDHYVAFLDSDDDDLFEGVLSRAETLVAHNLKFDIHQVRETLDYDVLKSGAELHDTDLMARVVHPEMRSMGGFGLKPLGKVLLRENAADEDAAIKDMAKSIGLRTIKQAGAYYDVWRAYPEVMEQYARQDARMTYDLYELLSPQLKDPALARVYQLEMAVLPILVRAEQRGVRIDPDAVARLRAEFEPDLAKVREYLIAELGEPALGGEGSTEALTEALLAIGVPLTEKTPTGVLATNKFALSRFVKDFPQLEALEEYRTLSRFLSTYIGAVEGRDTVHCDFQQFEAWTGRMSCRRPNLQNFPKRAGKEVRSVFIPREGHAFVVCDYDSIEVRLLAYYLNDPDFSDLINSGHDPHAWMAANIWGGEISDYHKGTSGEAKRGLAKNILFAISYGAGAPRVMNMLMDADMPATREEAKSLISNIKGNLPGYYRLSKRIRNKIEDVGYVNTIMGRKNIVNKDKSYVGMNALIQGSAADLMKQGLVNVDRAVKHLDGHPLLVVHDEVVIEVPTEHAEECLALTKAAMRAAYPLKPHLEVSGSVVTTNYADA